MNIGNRSPVDGISVKIYVKQGALIDANGALMVVRPYSGEMSDDT